MINTLCLKQDQIERAIMSLDKSEEIVKLTDYGHHRLRTEMYLGSRNSHEQIVINWDGKKLVPQEITWTPAAFNAYREILDNALDEIVGHGHGNRIDITYDVKNQEFTIADDGRGIPIDWDDIEKMHKATIALTHARAGRNFGDREEVRGTNGIGSSVVVNCCEFFNVVIHRNGQRFSQSFREGNTLIDALYISEPEIKPSTSKSGTAIHFKLSKSVFKKYKLPLEFVKARVFDIAANHPKLHITFNGTRVSVKPTIEKTLFTDRDVITIDIKEVTFKSRYYLVPNFAKEGEYLHTTVNDIPAFNGGQHIDTFKKLFYSGLIKALDRESRRRGLTPNRSDIAEGLLIYNITSIHAPNFDSQSKSRLINDEVDQYIKACLGDEETFKRIIKTNKKWIDEIYTRCANRTQKKDDADIAKLGRKMLRTKVPKLLDANGRDRTKCILLITEGDCIQENTLIKTVEDGHLIDVSAKNVKIGDVVLSHKNKLQLVTEISRKVTKSISIQTSVGELIVGEQHKLLTFNKKYQTFEYTMAKDLDLTIHQLVKNKYSYMSFMQLIHYVDIDLTNQLPVKIIYGDENELYSIESTVDHLFGVYNIEEMLFEKIKATDLKPKIHALVMG